MATATARAETMVARPESDDPPGAGNAARQPPYLRHACPGDPRRQPDQAERKHLGHLLGQGLMPGRQPGPDPEGVTDADREQGEIGQEDPPPARDQGGQQHAQHRGVHQRVHEAEQERTGPLTRTPEVRAEQRDPADDEQGDGHDVTIGERGKDRAGVSLVGPDRRVGPVRPPTVRGLRGQGGHADHERSHGQERRHVRERERPGRPEGAGEKLVGEQPREPEHRGPREPAIAPGGATRLAGSTEQQAHHGGARNQEADDVHLRFPQMSSCT